LFDLTEPEQLGLSSARLARIADWTDRLVETGQLAGSSVLISRHGRCGWFHASGRQRLDRPDPISKGTIFRIYSMTKPVTSVAAMMLYERGLFQLDDPISAFLPEFARMQVYAGGAGDTLDLEEARAPITIRHLLTHTSGLAHRLLGDSPVHALYRAHDIDFGRGRGSLADMTRELAELPLLFHPGTRWNYGVSTDVLGRLVEVLSGKSLDEYFAQEIFAPLGMRDTAFSVAGQDIGRLSSLYTLSEQEAAGATTLDAQAKPQTQSRLVQIDPAEGGHFSAPVSLFSGGGGLTSTVGDYLRFALMLRNGGVLEDSHILGRKTVAFMRQNHLPGTLCDMGEPQFTNDIHSGAGLGFGLGFAVVLDPCSAQVIGSTGEYFWAGVGGTQFWIDPEEDLIVIQMAQMRPASLVPTRRTLRSLVYQALT
jgi:CubicO group peptidase (beta-lactamase class C family)